MAKFMKLTPNAPGANPAHVNVDQIAYFQQGDGFTTIVFAAPRREGMLHLRVTEMASDIASRIEMTLG